MICISVAMVWNVQERVKKLDKAKQNLFYIVSVRTLISQIAGRVLDLACDLPA